MVEAGEGEEGERVQHVVVLVVLFVFVGGRETGDEGADVGEGIA